MSFLPSQSPLSLTMGNSKSGALSKEILEELQLNTKFTEEELSAWYQSFLKECPSGRITRQEFESIYSKFFPDSDPKAYAQHVFRSFDANSDGTLDFKEYVIALHMTTAGKPTQKLEWAFSLYDVDGNGAISKNEVLEIVMVSVSLSLLPVGDGEEATGWKPQTLCSPVEWGPGQERGKGRVSKVLRRNKGHPHSISASPRTILMFPNQYSVNFPFFLPSSLIPPPSHSSLPLPSCSLLFLFSPLTRFPLFH